MRSDQPYSSLIHLYHSFLYYARGRNTTGAMLVIFLAALIDALVWPLSVEAYDMFVWPALEAVGVCSSLAAITFLLPRVRTTDIGAPPRVRRFGVATFGLTIAALTLEPIIVVALANRVSFSPYTGLSLEPSDVAFIATNIATFAGIATTAVSLQGRLRGGVIAVTVYLALLIVGSSVDEVPVAVLTPGTTELPAAHPLTAMCSVVTGLLVIHKTAGTTWAAIHADQIG